ncbi:MULTISPECIES: DUF6464 family protein [Calothrix]|uniref:Uncharacterized protein n=2 Tax=Calothrix TaxID=1186 RepID=A0ABR8A681_9CYAN|nr:MULTISPECIES: DUF6464 family protein [Calothrix]MBD2195374.1 hypothetical protein [Calothrix parietina FACHB-288]MBD2207140.1 hypothetical protein [Calothrix sp. FACHB-168]MBD2221797.1 hypothetical protein [Calothrix sp. FACHB-1219]MBD2223973.1 hypothetical protein [Calothrix anomala FACHB-343]
MLRTLLVIAIGFLPSLFSLWVIRKTHLRTRLRMRQAAMNVSGMRVRQNIRSIEGDTGGSLSGERYYLEGVGYLVGDISCKFNARSGYIRCAVNPDGPCQGCRHYEPKELAGSEQRT